MIRTLFCVACHYNNHDCWKTLRLKDHNITSFLTGSVPIERCDNKEAARYCSNTIQEQSQPAHGDPNEQRAILYPMHQAK
jgi:hypothetical protein